MMITDRLSFLFNVNWIKSINIYSNIRMDDTALLG